MNWEAISAIGQLVAAAGVVVSVIYLALQVRSSAPQTRLASMRTMSDAFNQWLQSLVLDPEVGDYIGVGFTISNHCKARNCRVSVP